MLIERLLYEHLCAVQTVPVYMEKPANPPESFYLVEKTGGDESNQVRYADFAIQSYAPSLFQAATLDETLVDYVKSLQEDPGVASVHHNSSYNFTNTQTKEYRYQSVYEVVYY